ncbi:MAG: phospho-N-acetylmuramoyl-pentapeptide-transferase [Lachnospirales bacterium]
MNQDTNILQMSAIAGVVAFVITVFIAPVVIPWLRRFKFGQQVRTDGPQTHLAKQGTPTIGGIIFLLGITITSLIYIDKVNLYLLLFMLSCGVIGFIDDYAKIKKKQSEGLNQKEKLIAQFIVTSLFLFYVHTSVDSYRLLIIPFVNKSLDLGLLYYPFFYLFTIGVINAVNITDGLDGLATGVTALVSVFFAFVLMTMGLYDEVILPFIITGALVSFLIFNFKPAKVFMGDTGSLALGGFIAGIATVSHLQIFILIVGIIYFVEALSVIIQTGYFKYTRKKYGEGIRVFKMAPYHHHLEQKGMGERDIVLRFYLITAIGCIVGYLII